MPGAVVGESPTCTNWSIRRRPNSSSRKLLHFDTYTRRGSACIRVRPSNLLDRFPRYETDHRRTSNSFQSPFLTERHLDPASVVPGSLIKLPARLAATFTFPRTSSILQETSVRGFGGEKIGKAPFLPRGQIPDGEYSRSTIALRHSVVRGSVRDVRERPRTNGGKKRDRNRKEFRSTSGGELLPGR